MINKQEQLNHLKRDIKDLDEHIAHWEANLVEYLTDGLGSTARTENYLKGLYAEKSILAQQLRMLDKDPDEKTEFKDYL